MSRILVYTSPARGHLYPIVDVALALDQAGHEVVVQTLADERDALHAVGLDHRPIAPEIEALELDDYRGGSPLDQIQRTFDVWLARAPLEVADVRRSVAARSPDLIVVDANCWGAAAVVESLGRPWVSFLPYVLPLASPDTPAFGLGFAPPRHALDRLRDGVVRTAQRLGTRSRIARLDALRASLGVGPVGRFDGMLERPDLVLYRTAVPFDYPRRSWPANVAAIGPGLWAPHGEAPAWLAELPRPRVLVSVSTELQEDGAIVETALAALADRPGSVIVTTAALDPARFRAPHERVRIERFVPHAQVIDAVDVVVTHGGMGTTQRALAAGVPVVVVPWGRDQAETARRADLSGAGVMLPRRKLDVRSLRDAVERAAARRDGACRVADAFAAAGGAERAVGLIDALLARAAPGDAGAPATAGRSAA